jgi:hypothetical protein
MGVSDFLRSGRRGWRWAAFEPRKRERTRRARKRGNGRCSGNCFESEGFFLEFNCRRVSDCIRDVAVVSASVLHVTYEILYFYYTIKGEKVMQERASFLEMGRIGKLTL